MYTILSTEVISTMKNKKTNCADEKWIWAGNSGSGPLELVVEVSSEGPILLCSSQGQWGKYPKRWVKLHEREGALVSLDGKPPQTVKVHDRFELCSLVRGSISPGNHTLKIKASTAKYINIAHILVP